MAQRGAIIFPGNVWRELLDAESEFSDGETKVRFLPAMEIRRSNPVLAFSKIWLAAFCDAVQKVREGNRIFL